jgi:hypothetical protein
MGSETHQSVVFLLWALVACPAIGAVLVVLTDPPDSDAVVFGLVLGVPILLAVVGGIALRRNAALIGVGASVAPVIGFIAFLVYGG